LFKATQGFVEFANSGLLLSFETRRKVHVDFFVKVTMKEGVVDVKLMHVPSTWGKKGDEGANSDHRSDMTEGLRIIKACLLVVTLKTPIKIYIIPLNHLADILFCTPIWIQWVYFLVEEESNSMFESTQEHLPQHA